MSTYILRRVLAVIPTLFAISFLSFAFIRMVPGDPVTALIGERASLEDIARVKAEWGLDQPIIVQYVQYMAQVVRGNLGTSVMSRMPVISEIAYRLPATIEAIVFALMIGISTGIVLGIIAALNHNKPVDTVATLGALTGVSIPVFWLALILIYVFGVYLRVLPPSGRLDAQYTITQVTGFYTIDSLLMGRPDMFLNVLQHMILPSIVLSVTVMPGIARLTRTSILEVLRQDYIRTARAKGLPRHKVIFKHTLRNALLPVVTVVGLQIGGLLGGAILTESIFSWTGMGSWTYKAITNRDYPVMQASIMYSAFIYVFATLLVDISYAFIDPRIRYG
jgi:peptide/nickel transport system permease protein